MDNGSIYTKNLTDFLNEKNILFEKQIPQLLNLNLLENYNSVILSGRRKNEKKINKINSKVIIYSIQKLLLIQLKIILNYLEFVMVQKS